MTTAGIQLARALQQMAKMVRDARTRPDVQAFARRVAGPYKTTAERAQALLDIVRSNVRYKADPTSERVLTPIDAIDLITGAVHAGSFPADDDDMAVAFSAACEAIGMVTELRAVNTEHGYSIVVIVHDDNRCWTFPMHEPTERSE
jgi:transglutaminase-like putative cysteine protease